MTTEVLQTPARLGAIIEGDNKLTSGCTAADARQVDPAGASAAFPFAGFVRYVRCPDCNNIVAVEKQGGVIESRVATRGRNRRTVTAYGRAGFVCENCGREWEHQAAAEQGRVP